MFLNERLQDAELAFLNAPFEADGWLEAVRSMAEVTGSRLGQLCGIAGSMKLPYNILSDEPQDPHQHLHNPILYGPENWRIAVSRGVMQIQHDADYAAFRSAHRTSFYDDAMSDLDVPYGCQTALSLRGDDILGLALLRSNRDGPCSGEVLQVFARLAWHAQRSMRVQMALGQEAAEAMLSAGLGQDEPTLLLDRYGQLLAMTDAAESFFDCPIGLRLDGQMIRLPNKAEDDAFQAALHRLLGSDRLNGPILHEMRAGRCETAPDGWWRLLISRLPSDGNQLGLDAQIALTLRPYERAR